MLESLEFHPGRRSAMSPPSSIGYEIIHRMTFLRTRRISRRPIVPKNGWNCLDGAHRIIWPCRDGCCGDRLAADRQSTAAVAPERPRLAGQPEESTPSGMIVISLAGPCRAIMTERSHNLYVLTPA
jgi:hypothetical protein